jgi:hypothetical protein
MDECMNGWMDVWMDEGIDIYYTSMPLSFGSV